jgi:molecular chaperone GrpE
VAPRDRKRTGSSPRGTGSQDESAEDALEKLFAEAMGSVQATRKAQPKPLPKEPDHAPVTAPLEVDIDESFLDEQSVHFLIDDEDSELQIPSVETEDPETSFGQLNAEILGTLNDDKPADRPSIGEDEDIRKFIADAFGENAVSDDDPDLAFPDFAVDDGSTLEAINRPSEEEVFALDDGLDVGEVAIDIGQPAGTANKKKKNKKKKAKQKTALPGPSIDEALRTRVANMGRTLEERDVELRGIRDHVNGLNAQLVAANRRGAAISREFETFRRRAERDREDHKKYAAEKVLKQFLGVFDNLERALGHAGDEKGGPLGQGVSMTLHQFASTLSQSGVVRVESSVGEKFDPVYHEAMGQTFSDTVPTGAIVEEMQAGFTLHDRLLRAAMVTVSRGPEAGPSPEVEEPTETAEEAGDTVVEDVVEENSADEQTDTPELSETDPEDADVPMGDEEPSEAEDGPETGDEADGSADGDAPADDEDQDGDPSASDVGSESEDSSPAP